MADYDWVNRRLAVGGAIVSLYDARKIAADGVTHVMSLREDDIGAERGWVRQAGMEFISNPTDDTKPHQPRAWFEKSIQTAWKVLRDPNATLLVHCRHGVNRGPATAYAILRSFGYGDGKAQRAVEKAHPAADVDYYADDAESALDAIGFK